MRLASELKARSAFWPFSSEAAVAGAGAAGAADDGVGSAGVAGAAASDGAVVIQPSSFLSDEATGGVDELAGSDIICFVRSV